MVSLVLKDCQEDLAFVLVAENVYFVPSRKAFVHLLLNYTCLYVHVHVHSVTHTEDRGQRASLQELVASRKLKSLGSVAGTLALSFLDGSAFVCEMSVM